jgi:hypothetical protein
MARRRPTKGAHLFFSKGVYPFRAPMLSPAGTVFRSWWSAVSGWSMAIVGARSTLRQGQATHCGPY